MFKMVYVEILGYVAGILTVFAFLPQVIKIWKTKSTKDISLATFIILIVGAVLWLVYAVLIKSFPMVITNLFILVLASIILHFKLKYG